MSILSPVGTQKKEDKNACMEKKKEEQPLHPPALLFERKVKRKKTREKFILLTHRKNTRKTNFCRVDWKSNEEDKERERYKTRRCKCDDERSGEAR